MQRPWRVVGVSQEGEKTFLGSFRIVGPALHCADVWRKAYPRIEVWNDEGRPMLATWR